MGHAALVEYVSIFSYFKYFACFMELLGVGILKFSITLKATFSKKMVSNTKMLKWGQTW